MRAGEEDWSTLADAGAVPFGIYRLSSLGDWGI